MGILASWRKRSGEDARSGFRFDRPLVLLQSDDWGRVGVRDQDGCAQLRAAGLNLGESPYDFYSLETAEDVAELTGVLKSVEDSTGRSPCLEMNFITANVDFGDAATRALQAARLKPLVEGLPGSWSRQGLYDAYFAGINCGVLLPSLHGTAHFCVPAMKDAIAEGGHRRDLIRLLWSAETPYIHWRMPWVGYEYWNPNRARSEQFLDPEEQRRAIAFAAESFGKFFGRAAISACAPGYRANDVTVGLWREHGIRVAQNGPGATRAPHFDKHGVLHTYRSIDFEPALKSVPCDEYLASARKSFACGVPFVVSMHSINFHSTLAPYRQKTMPLLHELLQRLAREFPDLLFVNTEQLLEIIETGSRQSSDGRVRVAVVDARQGAAV